jgi:hypothetical protein
MPELLDRFVRSTRWSCRAIAGVAIGAITTLSVGCGASQDVPVREVRAKSPLVAMKECDKLQIVGSSYDPEIVGTVVSDAAVLKALYDSLNELAGSTADITGEGIATQRWVEFKLESEGRIIGNYVLYGSGQDLGYKDNGRDMMLDLSNLEFSTLLNECGKQGRSDNTDKPE